MIFCHSIDEGIPLKEIRARMGHKSIPTTMDTYGHLYKDRRGAIGEHLQNMHVAAEASIPTTMDTYGHLYKDRRGAIGEHLQNMHVAAEASLQCKM